MVSIGFSDPWATRALLEHVVSHKDDLLKMDCLEPACGAGHMAKVLREYFRHVRCADISRYGYGEVGIPSASLWNQVLRLGDNKSCFKLTEEFVLRALQVAREGVAILARTVFIESVGRYRRLLQHNPAYKVRPVHRARSYGEGPAEPEGVSPQPVMAGWCGSTEPRPIHGLLLDPSLSQGSRTGR